VNAAIIAQGAVVVHHLPFAYDSPGISDGIAAYAEANEAPPVLPLVVVGGTNDTFIYTPVSGGPETFTVAPGSYANVAACAAAMAAATGTDSDVFGDYVTPSVSSGVILVSAVVTGAAHNGDTVKQALSGHDVLGRLGFTSPPEETRLTPTFTFAGGGALGLALYVPTPGDVLMDAWICVFEEWDGTTPLGDFGFFQAGQPGFLATIGTAISVDSLQDMTAEVTTSPLGLSIDPAKNNDVAALSSYSLSGQYVPGMFATGDPMCVVVTTTGLPGGAPPGSTKGAAALYLVTARPVQS
jgi:hypothetical protein